MKKLYFIFVATLIVLGNSFNTSAQAPEGFTYQAEARDASGKLLVSKVLTVKTTILQGSATDGIDVWDRNYTVTTDKYGLFSIVIGDAPDETGFSEIDWGTGKYFLNVQIKYGNIWLNTGTTQLLSVPYALYAKSAGSAKFTETDPLWKASPSYGISNDNITNWNTASSWGDHAGLYRPANWIPSWNEVGGKLFRIDDSPLNGDLLIWDGGIARFINWTPNYLTTETDPVYSTKFDLTGSASGDLLKFDGSKYVKFTPNYISSENDPVYSDNFDLTNVVSGDFLKFNGNQFAKYSPDINQTNYTYGDKYGVKLQAQYGAQTHVDLVLSPKGYGSLLRQQPEGTRIGGNNRGERAIDLQVLRSENTEVASGNLSMIIGNSSNTASGYMSGAIGNFNKATGDWSTALGTMATASEIYTFAVGYESLASGEFSIAIGRHATASGFNAFSAGYVTTAAGYFSTAMGAYTTAPSGYEITTGRFNALYTPASTTGWNSNDCLFVVGNGTAETSRSNALTVLKNANTTIGGSLTINGNGINTSYSFPTERGTGGQVLKTNADGTTSWAPAGVATETDPIVKAITGLVKSNGTTISAAIAGTDYLAPEQAVTSVTGTSPIVSTGGTTPDISINPATTTEPGSMSATDKSKLDGIAAGAEVNVNADWNATDGDALIKNKPDLTVYATKDMNSANITNLADPVNAQDAATKAYVDALKAEVNILKLKVELLAGTPVSTLLAAGATIEDLFDAGAKVADLIYTGATIKEMLDYGATPSQFIGTYYAGGVIFSLDPAGSGLVCAAKDKDTPATWADAKTFCDTLVLNSYDDWFLPDRNQIIAMCNNKAIINITANAHGGQDFGDIYWTSVDVNAGGQPGVRAEINYFDQCRSNTDLTYKTYAVRAVRSFSF